METAWTPKGISSRANLNAGMGYACPWHKMEKLWLNLRVSSCNRSPDIVGATLPMGSEIEDLSKLDI